MGEKKTCEPWKTMLLLDLILAKRAVYLTLYLFSPTLSHPLFCFLSEPVLQVVNYSTGMVYVAFLNSVCVREAEEGGRSLISTET